MTDTTVSAQAADHTMTGTRLCASIGLFLLCNFAGAAVIPLIAMASA